MAARLNRKHGEEIRRKIQAGVIIDRLQKHFLGQLELTKEQIRSAEILLDRSVAKLSQIQLIGDETQPLFGRVEWVVKNSNKE